MSTFDIDSEIEKLCEQFTSRLKKLIMRDNKLVLKQYIASQKETARVANRAILNLTPVQKRKTKEKTKETKTTKTKAKKTKAKKISPRTSEKDYYYDSESSSGSEY